MSRRSPVPPLPSAPAATLLLFLLPLLPGCAPAGEDAGGEAAGRQGGEVELTEGADLTLGDSLEHWYALGIDAHHMCAGLWVVGRDHERTPRQVLEGDIARFPAFHWRDAYGFSVDSAAREVTVSAPADSQDWPTGARNARGDFAEVDRAALDSVVDRAFDDARLEPDQNTRGLVVVWRGKIIAERYAEGWGPRTPQISWSMGKSIASALTGVMVERGHYGLDDRAPVEEWRGERDPRSPPGYGGAGPSTSLRSARRCASTPPSAPRLVSGTRDARNAPRQDFRSDS